VAIDYPAALALRQMALVQDELPKIPAGAGSQRPAPLRADLHRKMLLATLWNTGARINEALADPGDFRWRRRIRCAAGAQAAGFAGDQDGRSCPQAVRSIVWFPFPITTMSASCR
jgi:hypothetical protein